MSMSDRQFTETEIFCRNIGAISKSQQRSLKAKKVAVIGCGGLGGHVIEQLVRLGTGCLHCFDLDVFTPSNCNRQLNALSNTLGKNKAQTAAERSATIHPHSRVIPFPSDFLNCRQEEAFGVDVVVDCLDNIQSRRNLASLCRDRNLPMVHGAVNGWCGQVGVLLPGGDLIDRLYHQHLKDEIMVAPPVLSFTVTLVASLQVCEAVKLLLGLPTELENSWLYVDLKYLEFKINR
jgi:molybdopterin-synthase adenylyltransferase